MTIRFRTVDMHTAGEPVRIIEEGYPALVGNSILDKRRDALQHHDSIRQALMLEPRGHAGMYGVIPVPPCDPSADLAVLFTHNEGYSTMCGHATVAIGRWAVDSGRVPMNGGRAAFKLETPCGVVDVAVTQKNSEPAAVSFVGVPSFVSHHARSVEVPELGPVELDISFGGAYYAILPGSCIGMPLMTAPLRELIEAATHITDAVRKQIPIVHPEHTDLGFLYGTILVDDALPHEPSYNLCVFADGQIDRSPTGSGVAARLALDVARGEARLGQRREFRGVSGQGFVGEPVSIEGQGFEAVSRIKVQGEAYYTARSEFVIESRDPFARGLQLPRSFGRLVAVSQT
jgi:proline racemase